jgi:hypothetical protein
LWQTARKLAGVGLSIAFVYFLVDAVRDSITKASLYPLAPGWIAILATTTALVAWVAALELGAEWILRRTCVPGCTVRWRETAMAFMKGYVLRYVPGKVWGMAVRVESLTGKVDRVDMLRCVLYEQIMLNGATLLVALAGLGVLIQSHAELGRGMVVTTLGLCSVLVVAVVWWPVRVFGWVNQGVHRLTGLGQEALVLRGSHADWRVAMIGYLVIVLGQGLVLVPLIRAVYTGHAAWGIGDWALALVAYPVSRLIGQVSMVAPGGLGVREGTYVLLVLPIMGSLAGSVIVVWARLLSVVAEIVVLGALWVINQGGMGIDD